MAHLALLAHLINIENGAFSGKNNDKTDVHHFAVGSMHEGCQKMLVQMLFIMIINRKIIHAHTKLIHKPRSLNNQTVFFF